MNKFCLKREETFAFEFKKNQKFRMQNLAFIHE
jgi:hypothetical protein